MTLPVQLWLLRIFWFTGLVLFVCGEYGDGDGDSLIPFTTRNNFRARKCNIHNEIHALIMKFIMQQQKMFKLITINKQYFDQLLLSDLATYVFVSGECIFFFFPPLNYSIFFSLSFPFWEGGSEICLKSQSKIITNIITHS
jgi:hypothetical protein